MNHKQCVYSIDDRRFPKVCMICEEEKLEKEKDQENKPVIFVDYEDDGYCD